MNRDIVRLIIRIIVDILGIAMDGNVSYGMPVLGRFEIGGYYPRPSIAQEGFKKYARIIRQSVSVLPPERRAPIGLYRVK